MSNEEIRRAILEMDEREELAKDMLEQVRMINDHLQLGTIILFLYTTLKLIKVCFKCRLSALI